MKKKSFSADSLLIQKYNRVFTLFAAFYYLIFLYCIIEQRYFGSVYQTALFRIVIALMVCSYFFVYRFQGGIELHLLALYCLWAIVTRIIHAEAVERWEYLVEIQLMLVWFIPGILLHSDNRDRYFKWLSWITIVFFTVLGLLCIIVAVTRNPIVNPLSGYKIQFSDSSMWGVQRILFLTFHPNGTGGLYLIAFSLSLTQFFRTKMLGGKVFALLSALTAFIVIALTVSRNSQTFASVVLGLMAGIYALSRLKDGQKTAVRVAVLIGVAAIVLIASYRLYEPIRKGLWQIHKQVVNVSDVAMNPTGSAQSFLTGGELRTLSSDASASGGEEEYQEDSREYLETGRKKIWWSALKSLEIDPVRLLCGSPMNDVMDISNSLIKEQVEDFHNCFLQIVNEFGLPALLLALAFFLKMIANGVAVVMGRNPACRLQDQMLVLPVAAMMGFNMLETKSFIVNDFTALFFFFACGILTGAYREKCRQADTRMEETGYSENE